jgi:hypothetical protein
VIGGGGGSDGWKTVITSMGAAGEQWWVVYAVNKEPSPVPLYAYAVCAYLQ